MSLQNLFFLASLFIFSGCFARIRFSKTGDLTPTPLPKDCKVVAYTSKPSKPFQEVGLMTFDTYVSTPDEALNFSRETICSNGGNGLLLWESQGQRFFKGTVIRTE